MSLDNDNVIARDIRNRNSRLVILSLLTIAILVAVAAFNMAFRWAVQHVVNISELVVTLVPSPQGLTEGVGQQPALPRVHAVLIDQLAEHVVFIRHHDVAFLPVRRQFAGIGYAAEVALGV